MTNEELMYANLEDQVFFLESIKGLPVINGYSNDGLDSNRVPMCFGVGSHSVKCLREISKIVKPKSILEIGFNVGGSSALWLELNKKANVLSCDVSTRSETEDAAAILSERYKPRFSYVNRLQPIFDKLVSELKFDMCFVDGSHEYEDVKEDLRLCLHYNIHYIAMDDWLPEYGFAQEAAKSFMPDMFEIVKVLGNIALLKNKTV